MTDLAALSCSFFTALLSDCLDAVGRTHQAMPSHIRPLDEQSIMVGRARTAAYREVYHVEPGINANELEMDLVDSLKPPELPSLGFGLRGIASPTIMPWPGHRHGAGCGSACAGGDGATADRGQG
jgi:hypothetical protein